MSTLHARRLAAWIAIFAMALAALAPTVSRALARGVAGPVSWTEVCTASGMQRVDPDAAEATEGARSAVAGEPDGSPPAHNPLDHCPFCLLTADRLGPPSSPQSPVWLQGDRLALAIQPTSAFRSFTPLAAHARGPPLKTPPFFVA